MFKSAGGGSVYMEALSRVEARDIGKARVLSAKCTIKTDIQEAICNAGSG